MVTGAPDSNTKSVSGSAMDSDKAISHSSDPDNTMVLGGSADHLGLFGPGGNLTLEAQHGFRCWPRVQASTQPSVTTLEVN